ncbi:MAG: RNA 2',3'-cyclic phosphodiesterase [Victivallales bacterium]|nr:RNA 2',3'-cyclic phosphodiesterase [Victivallales bacterium]MCF7888720.1 RNA 2',3'-cyclic phosphodiesterase [Victivallales bacterium]
MNTKNNNRQFRSFIAFELPDGVKKLCMSVQEALKSKGVKARWTKPQNQHLTINFLGDQSIERLYDIKTNIESLDIKLHEIMFKVSGIDYFGKPPRVLFLKVEDIKNAGSRTVSLITEKNSLKSEYKKWVPHLTLARFKTYKESRSLKNNLPAMNLSCTFMPESITIFTSQLTSEGPIYKPV